MCLFCCSQNSPRKLSQQRDIDSRENDFITRERIEKIILNSVRIILCAEDVDQ